MWDSCPSCEGYYDIDLTPPIFQNFADESKGKLDVKWKFV